MGRTAAIGSCLLAAFALVNFLEFHTWFYNNEIPAYLRGGVIHGEASGAAEAFSEAASEACLAWKPQEVEQCRRVQVTALGAATYVRPVTSAFGLFLTVLSDHVEFMQALKLAIIAAAIGGALLCGLLLLPFLARLEGRALAAIGLVWVAAWGASRLSYVAGSGRNIVLLVLAVVVVVLAAVSLVPRGVRWAAVTSVPARDIWPGTKPAATLVLQVLAIALCFAIGYRLHLLYKNQFPLLYLLLAVGLWPVLHRALPSPKNLILSGFLTAVLYISTTLVPSFHDLTLPKQHQLNLVGIFLFIAIWRDDSRVFWALPLVLLFDMQNGARLCLLIIVAESLVGLFRRQVPSAILPATVTAVIGVTVTAKTAFYPFDDRLYNISDAVGVFTTPVVLVAGLVALAILWAGGGQRPRGAAGSVALDRMFVYAAAVAVMAGIQIPTRGLIYDAFQLSSIFRGVAVAPIMAIFFVTVGMLLAGFREDDVRRRSAIASMAALLLLMSAARGRNISFEQLSEGVRASLGRYVPADWKRVTPDMTLNDNTVYYDMGNLTSGALMQYSIIKILLLSRDPNFSRDKLTILPFEGRPR